METVWASTTWRDHCICRYSAVGRLSVVALEAHRIYSRVGNAFPFLQKAQERQKHGLGSTAAATTSLRFINTYGTVLEVCSGKRFRCDVLATVQQMLSPRGKMFFSSKGNTHVGTIPSVFVLCRRKNWPFPILLCWRVAHARPS